MESDRVVGAATLRPVRRAPFILAALVIAAIVCGTLALISDDRDDETADRPGADPAATEAAPEVAPAPAAGAGEEAELPEDDRAAVEATVRAYIAALNRGQGAEVCSLLDPASVRASDLPRQGGGCATAVDVSIGFRRPGGTPAWKSTDIVDLREVSVGPDRARVTATVTHRFADRDYVSAEDDVIYLDHSGEGWLIAKPSGTFYRAVGYPEPPLRALTPPED